jgi:hypothetical protein
MVVGFGDFFEALQELWHEGGLWEGLEFEDTLVR